VIWKLNLKVIFFIPYKSRYVHGLCTRSTCLCICFVKFNLQKRSFKLPCALDRDSLQYIRSRMETLSLSFTILAVFCVLLVNFSDDSIILMFNYFVVCLFSCSCCAWYNVLITLRVSHVCVCIICNNKLWVAFFSFKIFFYILNWLVLKHCSDFGSSIMIFLSL